MMTFCHYQGNMYDLKLTTSHNILALLKLLSHFPLILQLMDVVAHVRGPTL